MGPAGLWASYRMQCNALCIYLLTPARRAHLWLAVAVATAVSPRTSSSERNERPRGRGRQERPSAARVVLTSSLSPEIRSRGE